MSVTFFSILSFTSQIAFAVMSIWIAVVVLRQNRAAGWMVLTGAILAPLISIYSTLGRSFLFGIGDYTDLSYGLIFSGSIVARFLFLGGLLMHLLRKRSESDRIIELEAIIRDRDQAP